MEQYYLVVDQSNAKADKTCPSIKHSPKPIKHSPKPIKHSPKLYGINNSVSPKTLKKNISNENFIKFQWAWVL